MNKLSLALLLIISQASAFASEINYSFNLSNEKRDSLISDFKVLETINFNKHPNNELNRILKIESLTSESLSKWITTRVNYIVEEDFNKNDEDIFVKEEKLNQEQFNYSKSAVFMTNYGAAVFAAAQKAKVQTGLYFINQENQRSEILIHSPRVGLLKVGPALFNEEYLISEEKNSFIDSLNRLSIIAHEARHSDGNGSSLGFKHTKCPAGHYLQGALACDNATNGSYAISSLLLKELTRSCQEKCTTSEKQALLMIVLDNASRVIRKGDTINDLDDTPMPQENSSAGLND